MKSDRARLLRLHRMERIRAIAKQAAALEAAEAESTLSQLEALVDRTRRLAAEYAGRTESRYGADLKQISRFAGGLQGIVISTASDAAKARGIADGKLTELGIAERRRAAVEDRAIKQSRDMTRRDNNPDLSPRKKVGTNVE